MYASARSCMILIGEMEGINYFFRYFLWKRLELAEKFEKIID